MIQGKNPDLLVTQTLLSQEFGIVGIGHIHFGHVDLANDAVPLVVCEVGEMFPDERVDDPAMILFVGDLPFAVEPDRLARFPQEAQPQRMERGDIEAVSLDSGQCLDSGPHLVGRFIGEGNAEDVPGFDTQVPDGVCDFMGDDPRFT